MVLSDRTIREEIEAGRIVIDPYDADLVQPSSVDLRVDSKYRVFNNSTLPVHRRAQADGGPDRAGHAPTKTSRSSSIRASSCSARHSSG